MTIHRLAYLKECDGCHHTIFMAVCRDGRWRPFETELVERAEREVWAWRKREGMEEQDLTRGYHIHYCADFHDRIPATPPAFPEAS